jgi:hypothetical protein
MKFHLLQVRQVKGHLILSIIKTQNRSPDGYAQLR